MKRKLLRLIKKNKENFIIPTEEEIKIRVENVKPILKIVKYMRDNNITKDEMSFSLGISKIYLDKILRGRILNISNVIEKFEQLFGS